MAYLGQSDDFDLDDHGILRDSMGDDLMMDDDGIVRDDDLDLYKHVTRGHWTDSGIGADKQSSTSTLQHIQNSFEEDLAPIGDESIHISEFEASKDDLSFDKDDDYGRRQKKVKRDDTSGLLDTLGTLESTLEKPDVSGNEKVPSRSGSQRDHPGGGEGSQNLFTDEYYRQLRDLGVLVDDVELSRDSLNEFEEIESRVASRMGEEGEGVGGERDLIGEYLDSEYRREAEEDEDEEEEKEEEEHEEQKGGANGRVRPESRQSDLGQGQASRASSARTVSSRSFPDEDYVNHSQDLGSQGYSQSQRMTGDDDEILYITSRILPTSPEEARAEMAMASGSKGQRPGRQGTGSGASTPRARDSRTRGLGSPGPNARRSQPDDDDEEEEDARSVFSESARLRSRSGSAASHMSTTSEIVSARQRKAEEQAVQRMNKAKSQESFFDPSQNEKGKKDDKSHGHAHKRLLPQPSTNEPSQSFKVRSKSATNVNQKSGPVKPTHVSLSEISRLDDSRDQTDTHVDLSELADRSSGELTERLTQEAQKRKQATELVQQLQKDYDNLLTKYALAELTIDHMRLGAKVTLHTDSPTPGQSQSGVISPALGQAGAHSLQTRASPSQGILMTSPAQAVMGHISPFTDGSDHIDGRPPPVPGDSRSRTGSKDRPLGGGALTRQPGGEKEEGAETVKTDLLTKAKDVDDRLESFHTLLEQRQLTLEEQEKVFEQIKSDHDTLRRAYLQAKEDHNVLRRSGAMTGDSLPFDSDKELEGSLFRLGMRFDEVQEFVERNLKERPVQRQPFQNDSSTTTTNNINNNRADEEKRKANAQSGHDIAVGSDTEVTPRLHHHHRRHHNNSQSNSIDSADDPAFEQHVYELREDYNANMDAYRKLKYLANTPEGEHQVENVVRRLNEICSEMPDMFRLSPEIQERCDKMKRENKLKMNDRKNHVWERLNQREQEKKNQRRSPVPQSPHGRGGRQSPMEGRPPSILRQGSEASDVDSLRARLDGSRSSLGSILPDRMNRPPSRSQHDRPSSRNGQHGERPSSRNSYRSYDPDRPPSRPGSRGADNSFSDSRTPRESDTSNPNLPRPRRHQHGMRDPKLGKMPQVGSVHSLPDSGISDQENQTKEGTRRPSSRGSNRGTGAEGADGALAKLPGPGKLKQMTKQRAADDADSGFIGSMVGSGVGMMPQQQQQQQQQEERQPQQPSLRLRLHHDESSTITDQSMDTSVDRQRDRRKEPGRKTKARDRATNASVEESYDGEEDTMETLDSSVGGARGRGGARPKTRGRDERKSTSLSATLEEDRSEESDVSTPRAVNQAPVKPDSRERRSSGTEPAASQTPAKPRRPPSRQQNGSEDTEEEIKEISTAKLKQRQSRAESIQMSDREGTPRKRLVSPPPAPRPKSRGSPTTDLYHTRERRDSNASQRSRRREGEVMRKEKEQSTETRAELRMQSERPQIERPRSRQEKGREIELGPEEPPISTEIADMVRDYETRSVGSSDVEVGSSVTRASSVNSSRLKALQEEIERLKEGVAQANEKASNPPPPAPQPVYQMPSPQPPAPERRQDPEYYDPFDDPYGFMRMPRRRANSFSGGREREWDEWYWTLPQNRQYDGGDIPLGYAAADAYADPRDPTGGTRERNTRENVKNRLRQRRMERRARGEMQVAESEPALNADPASAPPPGGLTDEQTAAMYDYYVPSRYSAQGMRQQMASRGYFTTPGGAKIYSSTGDEADGEEEADLGVDLRTGAQQTPGMQSRPWYQIRRAQPFRYQSAANAGPPGAQFVGGRRTQSQDDIRLRPSHAPPSYYNAGSPQVGVSQQTATQACPMCGGASYHTHTNYTHYPATSTTPVPAYSRDVSPVRSAIRRRSRSASRSRHYTPERSRSRTRYSVREYSNLSDSDEERSRRRSRSLSRGRSRTTSYRRREEPRRRRRSDSDSDNSGDDELGLDRSLSLSVDISRLTKKMMGTLRTELKRSKDKREFGSSYW